MASIAGGGPRALCALFFFIRVACIDLQALDETATVANSDGSSTLDAASSFPSPYDSIAMLNSGIPPALGLSHFPRCRKGSYGAISISYKDANETVSVTVNCTNCPVGKYGKIGGDAASSVAACEGRLDAVDLATADLFECPRVCVCRLPCRNLW